MLKYNFNNEVEKRVPLTLHSDALYALELDLMNLRKHFDFIQEIILK